VHAVTCCTLRDQSEDKIAIAESFCNLQKPCKHIAQRPNVIVLLQQPPERFPQRTCAARGCSEGHFSRFRLPLGRGAPETTKHVFLANRVSREVICIHCKCMKHYSAPCSTVAFSRAQPIQPMHPGTPNYGQGVEKAG
jgi:hypothetical protein